MVASDLDSIIKDNQVIVFAVSPQDFSGQLQDIARAMASCRKGVCYVSLNKPHQNIKSGLEKAGVDTEKFFYIDAVSSKAGSTEPSQGVSYVSSPQALTELSIAITKGTGLWKADSVLFDSLSTLLVYEGASSVLKFMHSVINSLRVKGLSCVFTVLKPDLKDEIAKDVGMFADRVEELG